jgi:hypothetical protein
MRSSLFPEVPGGLKRKELRSVFWLIRASNFARSMVPKGDSIRLRECCKTLMERTDINLSAREEGFHLSASNPLDSRARGIAALTAYFMKRLPFGIRLHRRGRKGGRWEYRLFRLEETIQDQGFYAQYGIPGFDTKDLWIDAKKAKERLHRQV